jgi:hypothetical protein
MITKNQKEALKKVFSLYENYVVMKCESGNNWASYAKDVVNAIPELAKAFPVISLENDKLGIFKNIYFKKEKGG